MTKAYELVIVGGGPVGMFAAFYASLRDVKVALIESLPELGGQPVALYPDKKIYDVAGLAGRTGRQLVGELERQLKLFPVDIYTSAMVTNLTTTPIGFDLTIDGEEQLQAKTVIMATGKGSFEPRRLQLVEAAEFEGQGLHYFVKNPTAFRNKQVAVLGGGDSALELALQLAEVTTTTYLIHRRDNFRAMEQTVKALLNSPVKLITPQKITSIHRQPNQQLQLELRHVKDTDQQTNLVVDDLIVQYGFLAHDQDVRDWDCAPDRNDYGVTVGSNWCTSEPGLFAIGDVSAYDGHADLIATGLGQAPEAVNAAIHHFDPNRGGPGHSSSLVL